MTCASQMLPTTRSPSAGTTGTYCCTAVSSTSALERACYIAQRGAQTRVCCVMPVSAACSSCGPCPSTRPPACLPACREHGIQAPPHPLPNSGRVDVQTTGRQPAPGMVPAGHTCNGCLPLPPPLSPGCFSASPSPCPHALRPAAGLPPADFSAARMEASRFGDLWLRLGSGAANLYCHQGGCEHLLTFMVGGLAGWLAGWAGLAGLGPLEPHLGRLSASGVVAPAWPRTEPRMLRSPHPSVPLPAELSVQDVRLFDAACDPPLRRHYPFRITPPQHLVMRDCEVGCGLGVGWRRASG